MSSDNEQSHKIGEYLVKLGALNHEQVKEILSIQKKEPHKLFGVIAIELGYVNENVIKSCIASQKRINI